MVSVLIIFKNELGEPLKVGVKKRPPGRTVELEFLKYLRKHRQKSTLREKPITISGLEPLYSWTQAKISDWPKHLKPLISLQ